jgi:hypothetical protein
MIKDTADKQFSPEKGRYCSKIYSTRLIYEIYADAGVFRDIRCQLLEKVHYGIEK